MTDQQFNQRMEFLLRDSEALHSNLHELHAGLAELRTRAEQNDRYWQRVKKIVRAALEAAVDDDDSGGEDER